ncbi:MAG: ATP-binding protein [Myxococcota bacterium]
MPLFDTPACQVLVHLAAAATARQVAESLAGWVVSGQLQAIAVWTLDGRTGPLRPLHAEGVDASILEWKVLPGTQQSPLWRAIESGEDLVLTEVSEKLAATGVPHWRVVLLRGKAGNAVGVALCGLEGEEAPEHSETVFHTAGLALERAQHADRHAVFAGLFAHVAELTRDGVITATPDGAILAYNPALEKLAGWTPEEVRTHGWTNLVYPDPVVRDDLQRGIVALMMGTPSEGVVRTLACKDGTQLNAAIWSRLVPHPSGFPPAMIGVLRDVTSDRVARRRAIWEESHAQLGRLAGGIAHEFNNLLAAVMGHAEIVALLATDESIRSHADTIVRSAERGAELSTQLLAFSGSGNTRTDPVSIPSIVGQVAELFRARLLPGVTLDVSVTPGLPPIEADAGQIHQVLMNLLGNALDAVGPSGTLTLAADLAPIPEAVRYRSPHAPGPDDALVRLRLRDDGPGFSADALANLFVPFYSGKAQGHGVGLPAVRGIVGAHGGAIDVWNDSGAVIDVYLPVSTRPELTLPALLHDSPGHGEHVWLVDDQPAVLEFSTISLESRGYAVRGFATVAALREALTRDFEPPGVVVLDVVMPDGGGPAALEALTDAGLAPAVVWTSGHTPDHVELPEDAAFLQKPYTGADLASVVNRALSRG